MQYKIVIADDHALVAAGLERIIESFNHEVLYKVANGKELLDKFASPKNIPDLVLLDISMPIMDGYQTMKVLHKDYHYVKVLGLSMVENDESFLQLIELGAHGFFPKMGPEDELKLAINTIMKKGEYYSDEVNQALFRMLRERNNANADHITPREKELMTYIGTELTYADIAKKMGVSLKSVDGYRNSLFKKLQVKSRATLTLYAYTNGYFIK